MSAETDIHTLLSHAMTATSQMAAESSGLVNTAVEALESDILFPRPRVVPVNVQLESNTDVFNPARPAPPGFPAWPLVTFNDPPPTQEQDVVNIDIDSIKFPNFAIPDFKYPALAGVPKFNLTTPNIDAEQALPNVPNTDSLFTPNFSDELPVDQVTMAVTPSEFMPISEISFNPETFDNAFSKFKSSIMGGRGKIPGLDGLIEELHSWSQTTLDAILPLVLEVISKQINSKYSAVLAFQSDIRARLTDRLVEEQARVNAALNDKSGWGLPQAVLVARQAVLSQILSAVTADINSAADTQTAELSLDFFEVCGEILANFTTMLQKVKAQEIAMVLEAHEQALAYAKAAIAALLTEYEVNNFTMQDIEYKQAESNLKLFEAELTVAMLTYEVARANLQVEEAKQENDSAAIQACQSKVASAQRSVELYAAQVTAAKSEVQLKKLPVDRFVLMVKAYDSRINAFEAEVSAQVAAITSDTAMVEGQLKKVEAYEAEARGFMKLMETKQSILEAEATRNDAVIAEFEMRVKAMISKLEKDILDNNYEMKKYEVLAADALAEAKLKLDKLKSEFDFSAANQDGKLKAYELTQERGIELMKVELERLSAIAEVNEHGANTMAHVALGAMSSVNAIAAAILSEDK